VRIEKTQQDIEIKRIFDLAETQKIDGYIVTFVTRILDTSTVVVLFFYIIILCPCKDTSGLTERMFVEWE